MNPILNNETTILFEKWRQDLEYIEDVSKLYTPDLDEFCLGFRYHEQISKESCYAPKILGYYHGVGFVWGYTGLQGGPVEVKLTDIRNGIESGSIKVKKLDHDDFLELGFEELPMPEDMEGSNYFKLTEGDYVYSIWQEEDRYAITIGENDKWGESIVFYGKIRNKFELSKILNQVKWTSETK